MNVKKNIGLVDQLVRALLVLDLVVPCMLGLTTGVAAFSMICVAGALLVTCTTGYCWLYNSLNLTTR